MIGKMLGAKVVAAAVLATAAVGTAAAAATGALPDAAQAKAHHIVAAVPDAEPAGHGTGSAVAATHTPKAGGASDHPALPGVAGLCQAYGAGNGGENGHRLDSTAFGRLAGAAGGADKITTYCRTVTAAATPAAGDHTGLAGACRSWQAADRAGRAASPPVLARLTAAAGGADAVGPYCAALVGDDKGGGADKPSVTPPAAPRGNTPTAPPGNDHGHGSPSHPAPPTPRG